MRLMDEEIVSDDELQALEARVNATTPGPWVSRT
jgi:hypothetical protein